MFTEKLKSRKNYFLAIIVASILIISYLHYFTLPGGHDLHNIFTELYYMPLVLAAIVYGMKGAVLAFLLVSVMYFPYIILNWTDDYAFIVNKLLHALFSGVFSVLAGYLVERERRNRLQMEKDRYLAGLGQAAAAIVHDLRNPLITIMGFARRIRERKGDPDQASEVVMKSAEDMQAIVEDVLDFAKPIRLEIQELDIRDIINSATEYCMARADEKGAAMSVDLPDGPVYLGIDRSHMQRALVNLINNAIDASKEGDHVIIRASVEDDLHIVIRDDGQGMDKETLENVFIPFYTKKSSGTGLGMVIAKKIIDAHRGEILVESTQGMGTKVKITLPLEKNMNEQ